MTQTSKMKPIVLRPDEGRHYDMGRMSAVFKADGEQTDSKFSISEWWLEPRTPGPGVHQHPDDHVFYVIEGCVSIHIDGVWHDCVKGAYALIPGGALHDFENRSAAKAGFISFNVGGGFESEMPGIVQWFVENPLKELD